MRVKKEGVCFDYPLICQQPLGSVYTRAEIPVEFGTFELANVFRSATLKRLCYISLDEVLHEVLFLAGGHAVPYACAAG